ncbi:MAG: tetratricopeptide repeat protein [Candidatus Aenigmatarchaeota archaeon]
MAILSVSESFAACHGSFDIREGRYDVGVHIVGPVLDGFVAGVDSSQLKASLSGTLSGLDGRYLDDMVGRATNENIGLYIFYHMRHHPLSSVEIAGDRSRVTIQDSDTNHDRYSARLTYEKARSLLYRGMTDEALKLASDAIALDGSFAPAYNFRGRCKRAKNLWSDALPDFEQASALDPSFGEAFRNMGNALYYIGRLDEMLQAFSRAVELIPSSALAFNNRGFAYQKLEEWELALDDHRRALDLDPNYAEAYIDCANALSALGRPTEAEKLKRTAHELRASGNDTYSRKIFY